MRRALLALSALAILPAAAFAATLGVPLDQSVRLTLTGSLHDVIVGNPSIADVSVDDDHHLIVTGKAPGMTNLIVTDQRGRTIFDRQIVVHAGGGGGAGDAVTLIAGATATTFACAPTCETTSGAPATYGASPTLPTPAAPATATAAAPPAASPAAVTAPAPSNTSAIQASPGLP